MILTIKQAIVRADANKVRYGDEWEVRDYGTYLVISMVADHSRGLGTQVYTTENTDGKAT